MDSKNGWFEFSNPLDLSSYLFDVILIKRNSSQIFFKLSICCENSFPSWTWSSSRWLQEIVLKISSCSASSAKRSRCWTFFRDEGEGAPARAMLQRARQPDDQHVSWGTTTSATPSSSPCEAIRGGILIPSHAPWWRLWLWSCVFKPPTFPVCSSEIFAALWV